MCELPAQSCTGAMSLRARTGAEGGQAEIEVTNQSLGALTKGAKWMVGVRSLVKYE